MNPRSMQWQKLAAKAVAGELEEAELEQLVTVCRESAEARHALSRAIMVERLLPLAMQNPSSSLAAHETVLRIEHDEQVSMETTWKTVEKVRSWLWRVRLKKVSAAAAAILVIGLGLNALLSYRLPPATVMRSEGMVWVGTEPKFEDSALRRGQRLQGANGLLELSFNNGARMVLEGPFDVEVQGQSVIQLHGGRVSVRCPNSAKGFTVKTEFGEVEDLGTEFCVDRTRKGEMEVHVLEGAVVLRGQDVPRTVLLQGEAAHLDAMKRLKRIGADSSAFVTEMPLRSGEPTQFIHWSFDEDADQLPAKDLGSGLGDKEDTTLYLKQLERANFIGEPVRRIGGVYGKALSLNGKGGFAETPFLGIAGNQARSIALWVRVPKDLKQHEGHGIVSWGSLNGPRAWQLSANMADGPQGRLRIGTYDGGCVIGSTDLRDGLWHHVAVVMYGGSRPNLATNVLLYVDGKKETVTRRTSMEIETNILEAGHGVWMGRCITFTNESAEKGASLKFFRGDVDEVYIFNAALAPEQIQQLFEKNEAPR